MVDAALILSKSAFATRRGVSVSAVSQWLARGRIGGAAITVDGRIDVAEAERQLGSTLDLSRSLGKMAARDEPAPAPAAPAPVGELAAIKLEQARRQLQRDRDSDLERRGLYVETAAIRRAHARELAEFVATVEQRLPELVALLDNEAGKARLVTARRWWRSLRQAESGAAAARAAALPEFVAGEDRHAA